MPGTSDIAAFAAQAARASRFRALHVPGNPLILFNIWDAGSAAAVAGAGASAIATGSWSVAAALGHTDGEDLPLDMVFGNLARIVAATDLPVSIDLESGYAATPEGVADTISRAIQSGAIGCNLEDSEPKTRALRALPEATARLAAARNAAAASGRGFFINARTDIFLLAPPPAHDSNLVDQALMRAEAFAAAGADGLFVPGLVDSGLIEAMATKSPLPVNIMAGASTPSRAALATLGVARISHGPGPYRVAMRALAEAAQQALA